MNVDSLLQRLTEAATLRERLGIVAAAWPQMRKLPRRERENVALGLGSGWATRRVLRLLDSDPDLSAGEELARRALERLGDSDPAELRRLAGQLQQGDLDGLEQVFVGALGAAVEARADEIEAAPPPPGAAATTKATSPIPEREIESPGEEIGVAIAGPEPEAAARPAEAALLVPPQEAEPEPPQALPNEPEEPAAIVGASVEQLVEARLGDEPGGRWERRRSLSARIRERELTDLDSALDAIARLAPSDQAWCLGDLVQYWTLDSAGLASVLAASPDPRTRRRLAQRAQRHALRPAGN